jgi:predicted metal-dependent peptidase
VPAGMQRVYDELHEHQLNWRTIIRRAIAGKIPYDYTYNRPNKKYTAFPDLYMPSMYGEKVKVVCAIDTSGSISKTDMSDFISEIIGIARSFAQVEFVVLTHDVEVHQCLTINTRTIDEIEAIVPEGGGGTSHIPLFEYLEENRLMRETKFFISFTDGDSEFPEDEPRLDMLFVLGGHHCSPERIPYGDVITLD